MKKLPLASLTKSRFKGFSFLKKNILSAADEKIGQKKVSCSYVKRPSLVVMKKLPLASLTKSRFKGFNFLKKNMANTGDEKKLDKKKSLAVTRRDSP